MAATAAAPPPLRASGQAVHFERFPVIFTPVADSRFARTQAEFRALYNESLEKGSQLTVYVDGKVVLDMYGGRSDNTTPSEVFTQDQITTLFSCGKVVESVAVAMLVDQGLVKYETKVVDFIPGFYDTQVTVKELMQHRAGSAGIEKPADTWVELQGVFKDKQKLIDFINNNLDKDNLKGGVLVDKRATRYHAVSRGMFIAVMFMHYAKTTLEDFVQVNIVKPVQEAEKCRGRNITVEMHIGVPEDRDQRYIAVCEDGDIAYSMYAREVTMAAVKPLIRRAYNNDQLFYQSWLHDYEIDFYFHCIFPPFNLKCATAVSSHDPLKSGLAPVSNTPYSRIVHSSSSHGASNAPSLAAIVNEFAMEGGVLLKNRATTYAAAVQTDPGDIPYDTYLCIPCQYSQGGFGVNNNGQGWTGWAGAGGSILLWHAEAKAVMCYVPTRLNPREEHFNAYRLRRALEQDLGLPVGM